MISPDQVSHLQDQHDKYSGILVVGCLLFLVGATMGIFASQEFGTGTNFMQQLSGAESVLGVLLIAIGWIKVRSINGQFERHSPQAGDQAMRAGVGH
jgi:hypothetical protein